MRYPDIYFEPNYAKLYAGKEDEVVEYVFQNDLGTVSNLFIKRKIETLIDGLQYYDITTPYGYGGPIIRELKEAGRKSELVQEYISDFERYISDNRIISEFIRFHPLLRNAQDFQAVYQCNFDRKTVGTDLTYDDVIGTEFSRHRRKDIRRILKEPGISYEIDEHPETLDDFIDIYYSTMDRDGAGADYYFKSSYFRDLLERFPEHVITAKVLMNDRPIAMGIYFRYQKYLHAHLSGTLSEYLAYSPAYILKYALALYGHEHGYEVIHYGGGSSRAPDNSLYRFKKEFGKNTEFDFYIGKKIWHQEIYDKLCCISGKADTVFFPAYRANMPTAMKGNG